MNPLLIVSSFLLFVSSIRCSDEVPVIAWGSGLKDVNVQVSPFEKLSTSDFHKVFLKKLVSNEPSAMVLFVQNSLSPEDLSSEDSAYPLVQEMIESDESVKYLPYVSNPLKALETLNYERYKLSPQEFPAVSDSKKALFVVKLKDSEDDEDRLKSLQRYDKVIHELCSKIQQKYENSVCLLTAEQPSWIETEQTHAARKLLQTSPDDNKDNLNVYYKDDVGMIFSRYPPIVFIKSSKQSFNLSMSPTSKPSKEGNSLIVPLKYESNDVRVSFDFTVDNSSVWSLDSVKFTGSDKQTSPLTSNSTHISASIGNSFHTPSNVTFDGDKYQLIFKGLQAEYFESTHPQRFGAAEDSVYFFTIPILSGLFVTSLLVTIVLIGLTMIFDIKTMDQFDDPKGKSITINASE